MGSIRSIVNNLVYFLVIYMIRCNPGALLKSFGVLTSSTAWLVAYQAYVGKSKPIITCASFGAIAITTEVFSWW